MKKSIVLTIALLLLTAFTAGCGSLDSSEEPAGTAETEYVFPAETETAGGLSNFATLDLYGETVDQSIFSGYEVTMVNVWGTFCGPCLEEMPYLGEIHGEYKEKGLNIIGIVVDLKDESGNLDMAQVQKAQKAVSETGAGYVHLIPSGSLEEGLLTDVMYIPHTVFVDKEGNIISTEYTGSRSKTEWIEIIETML